MCSGVQSQIFNVPKMVVLPKVISNLGHFITQKITQYQQDWHEFFRVFLFTLTVSFIWNKIVMIYSLGDVFFYFYKMVIN